METFTLKLDPDTREELYSDIHDYLIEFIMIEAINLSGKEITTNQETMLEAMGDDEFHLNDPELDMDGSIRSILDYMVEVDRESGIDITAEDYDIDQCYDKISDKLVLALASLTAVNPALSIVNFYERMQNPIFHGGMGVSGSHLGNILVLTLTVS